MEGNDPSRKAQKQDYRACFIGNINNKPTVEIKLNYSIIPPKKGVGGREEEVQSTNKKKKQNYRFKSNHINKHVKCK